jgi:ABC-type glycerol-3-phosphate transport system substrate-binding protein
MVWMNIPVTLKTVFNRLKTHKDIVFLALALVIVTLSLFKLPGRDQKSIKAKEVPVLVFTHWWEGKDAILENLKNEFRELHPDIEIRFEFRPYDELRKALRAESAREAIAADIVAMDPLWFPEFKVQEKIEAEEFALLNFFHPLFYNIDILKRAGFSRPPKTWSEFLTQVRAVSAPEVGRYGMALALGPDNFRGLYRDIYSWLWAGGIRLADLQKPPPNNRTPAEVRFLTEVLAFLSSLHREKTLFPKTFSLGEEEKRTAFLEGSLAFMIGSAEDIENLRRAMGEGSVGYTSIPVPDTYSGKPIFGSGGWSLAITRESTYKDEARGFIQFFIEQSSRLAEGWAIPEHGNHNEPHDSFYSKAWELYITGDLIREFSGIKRDELEINSLDTIFREELINLFEGKTGAPDAAGKIYNRLQ